MTRSIRVSPDRGAEMTAPAVAIRGLKLTLPAGGDRPLAVDDVSFDLMPGQILCVVGESGSGKSMCAHALMGLLPPAVKPQGGEIAFDGRNLLDLQEDDWLALRGRRIAMVFQDTMTEIGRASCRERVCQYVLISVVAVS